MHLLHSQEENLIEFLRRRVQLGLQAENFPVTLEHFAVDHVSTLLEKSNIISFSKVCLAHCGEEHLIFDNNLSQLQFPSVFRLHDL